MITITIDPPGYAQPLDDRYVRTGQSAGAKLGARPMGGRLAGWWPVASDGEAETRSRRSVVASEWTSVGVRKRWILSQTARDSTPTVSTCRY